MFNGQAQNILSKYNYVGSISLSVAFCMCQNKVHDATILRLATGGAIAGMNVNTFFLQSVLFYSQVN